MRIHYLRLEQEAMGLHWFQDEEEIKDLMQGPPPCGCSEKNLGSFSFISLTVQKWRFKGQPLSSANFRPEHD